MTERSRSLCGIGVLCVMAFSAGQAAAQTQTGLTPRAVLLGLTNAAGEGSGELKRISSSNAQLESRSERRGR